MNVKVSMLEFAKDYYETYGEPPSIWHLLMFREAEATKRMEREGVRLMTDDEFIARWFETNGRLPSLLDLIRFDLTRMSHDESGNDEEES